MSSFPGILHKFDHKLSAFEFSSSPSPADNVLLFIGGLGDGLLTVPYVSKLAQSLPSNWVLIQTLISSSYEGWGTGSLDRDVKELSVLVKYLRSKEGGKRKKIILMGHSTGCQDTIHYITKLLKDSKNPQIHLDGGILQAPVSDSEAAAQDISPKELSDYLHLASDLINQGKGDQLMHEEAQKLFDSPINAYRFHSLASNRGDDDYFSTYLNEDDFKQSFGLIDVPILILYGEKDEFVPKSTDREGLVTRWKNSTDPKFWSPFSKVLKGASHNVGPGSDEGAVDDLIDTVQKFITSTS